MKTKQKIYLATAIVLFFALSLSSLYLIQMPATDDKAVISSSHASNSTSSPANLPSSDCTDVANSPTRLFIDGKEIKMDVLPKIIDGRALVPIRVIAENFGADVNWDGKNIKIKSKELKFTEMYFGDKPKSWIAEHVDDFFCCLRYRLGFHLDLQYYLSKEALRDLETKNVRVQPLPFDNIMAAYPVKEAPIKWDILDIKLKPDGSYDVYIKYLTKVYPYFHNPLDQLYFTEKDLQKKSYKPDFRKNFYYKWHYGIAKVIFDENGHRMIDKFTIIE